MSSGRKRISTVHSRDSGIVFRVPVKFYRSTADAGMDGGAAGAHIIPVREPEFIDGDIDLRINIYRGRIGESVTNVTKNVTETITKDKIPEEIIMEMIMDEPQVKMAEVLGVTSRTVKRILAEMKNDGLVTREGSE